MESYKTCPQCKTTSSLSAATCRTCGRIFRTKFPERLKAETESPLSPKHIKAIIIAVCVIVPLLVISMVSKDTQDPGYKRLVGNVYSGVMVYRKGSHDPLFKIIGGGDNHLFNDGQRAKGLKVIYSDGSLGWEMHNDAIHDETFLVKEYDPALSKMQWTEYEF